LREYVADKNIQNGDRVFPLGYTRAREIVKNAGMKIGIDVKPHDLRRHAATYASRSRVPIEIVSKIILRHSNLSTTKETLAKSVTLRPCFGFKIFIGKIEGDWSNSNPQQ